MSSDDKDRRLVRQKRKAHEFTVERLITSAGAWAAYARWEASQDELTRAKHVWEKAVAINPYNSELWLGYAQWEIENSRFEAARAVFERAMMRRPGNSPLRLAYVAMEESLGNVAEARTVFEKWTQHDFDVHGWIEYVHFELRQGEPMRAGFVIERLVMCHGHGSEAARFALKEVSRSYGASWQPRSVNRCG